MTDPVKLLPCPFCGTSDHLFIEPEETGSGGQWVGPIHAGCSQLKGCSVSRCGDDTDEAIAAWNTRPDLARDNARMREAAKQVLRYYDPKTESVAVGVIEELRTALQGDS